MAATATSEQREAISRRTGSLLLAAGAGSGKTTVLVERFVALVCEDAVPPSRILAITFTERAAGELRARIRERLLALGERAALRDLEGAEIGTVHAFCARLLRANALAAGLDPSFSVLDEPRSEHLRTLAFSRALAQFVGGAEDAARRAAVDLVAAYGADRLETAIGSIHEELRSRGQTAPALPVLAEPSPAQVNGAEPATGDDRANGAEQAGGEEDEEEAKIAAQARAQAQARAAWPLLATLLGLYGAAYERLKRERSALDFDDLELYARDLLEHDASVRDALASRLLVLMVDEFQDSNQRQLSLLSALERDNLCTVGDELQAIYGFRHADVSLFTDRRAQLQARGGTLALTVSFRARPELLAVINAAFAGRLSDSYAPLQAARPAVQGPTEPLTELLLTDMRGWEELGAPDVRAGLPPAAAWRAAEARLLAQRLADLVAGGAARPGDIAVLLRAGGDLPLFERALAQRGLPTLAAGAGGYWSQQQVGDLLAYLRTIANPLDEIALFGLLASPLVGVSSDGLALLGRAARGAQPASSWDLLCRRYGAGRGDPDRLESEPDPAAGEPDRVEGDPDRAEGEDARLAPADERALAQIWPWIVGERRDAGRRTPSELLVRALERTGYERYVCSLRWGERRLANVHKLLRLARAFERQEGADLRAFLGHAARQVSARAREAEAPVADDDLDAVRLMTIHAAKGLEFGVVALADLGRLGRVDTPDVLVDDTRAGLRLVRLSDGCSITALDYDRLRAERLQAQDAEESRVMYVAMTRARERLILSGAANLQRWPADRPGAPPMSWLAPALVGDVQAMLTEEEPQRECHPPDAPDGRVQASLSSPATFGRVLREISGGEPGDEGAPASAGRACNGLPQPPDDQSQAVADAPRAPQTPATLSYTALHEHALCGYRYYLERVLGLPATRRPGSETPRRESARERRPRSLDARTRGSLVHRLLAIAAPFGDGGPAQQAVVRVARELRADPDPVELREICDLLAALATTELGARIAAAPRLVREHPFALSLGAGRPLVSGVVDAMAHELDGGWLIVDYKSDRVKGVDLALLTEREYGIQRRVYALAALRAGASRVDVVHWYLERPHEPVLASFAAELEPSLTAWLCELADRVAGGDFRVTGAPHAGLCGDCPGRAALCRYDEAVTLRAAPA